MWEPWKKDRSKDDSAFSGTELAVRCYESHPVLKVGKGKLYGGSASNPMIKNADVYVALQSGATSGRISDPWDEQKVVEVQYSISDMQTPTNVPRFKKMITWLCTQLQNGKHVHVGCIGGHGRTGMVLSAIVAEIAGKTDYPAIQYVREHYCKKAVESKAQVQFLMKHYGVTEVEPAKVPTEPRKWTKVNGDMPWSGSTQQEFWEPMPEVPKSRVMLPEGVTAKTKSYTPLASSARSLWKRRKRTH